MRKYGRKCQGCSEIMLQETMHKITRNKTGVVELNPPSNFVGRSVYVCKNTDCIKTLVKKKRIARGLKVSGTEQIKKIEEKLSS